MRPPGGQADERNHHCDGRFVTATRKSRHVWARGLQPLEGRVPSRGAEAHDALGRRNVPCEEKRRGLSKAVLMFTTHPANR